MIEEKKLSDLTLSGIPFISVIIVMLLINLVIKMGFPKIEKKNLRNCLKKSPSLMHLLNVAKVAKLLLFRIEGVMVD